MARGKEVLWWRSERYGVGSQSATYNHVRFACRYYILKALRITT